MSKKNQNKFSTILVGATLGLIVGAALGYNYSVSEHQRAGHTEISDNHQETMTSNHSHETLEIPLNELNIPSVEVKVIPDPKSGFNIQLQTSNFSFAPENASTEHIPGEGHAHIYLDGEKISRVYGEWYYLDGIESGEHTISVNLNTNDHRGLIYQGKLIEAETTIVVE